MGKKVESVWLKEDDLDRADDIVWCDYEEPFEAEKNGYVEFRRVVKKKEKKTGGGK